MFHLGFHRPYVSAAPSMPHRSRVLARAPRLGFPLPAEPHATRLRSPGPLPPFHPLQPFPPIVLSLSPPLLLPPPRTQAGYISSWSAYRAYLRANPGQPDPLQAFRAQCEAGLRQQAEAGAAGAGAGGGEGQGQGAGQGAAVPQLRLERDAVLLLALRPVPLE